MPRVINDSELTTGLTKARPVVIPDRMPMTTLNLDLDGGTETRRRSEEKKKKKKNSNSCHSKCLVWLQRGRSVHRDKHEAEARL